MNICVHCDYCDLNSENVTVCTHPKSTITKQDYIFGARVSAYLPCRVARSSIFGTCRRKGRLWKLRNPAKPIITALKP